MTPTLCKNKFVLYLFLLCLIAPFSWGQNGYFEISSYIDNGNPKTLTNYDYQSHSDPEINRVYYYGRFNKTTSTVSSSTPGNFLTTNGTHTDTSMMGNYAFLMVTDTTGTLEYSTLIPFGPGNTFNLQLYTKNGDVYLYGNTPSDSLATTNNSNQTSNSGFIPHGFIIKYSNNTISSNGVQPDYASYIGDSSLVDVQSIEHDGNTLWLLCRTGDTTLPVTQVANSALATYNCYLLGISDAMMAANSPISATPYARYFTSDSPNLIPRSILSNNGNLYLLIRNLGGNFYPITQSSSGSYETVLVKISAATLANNLAFTAANGNYSTYIPIKASLPTQSGQLLLHSNNKILLCGFPDGANLPFTVSNYPFDLQGLTIAAISESTMNNNLAFPQNNSDYLAQTGMPTLQGSRIRYESYQGDLFIYTRAGNTNPNNLVGVTNNNAVMTGPLYLQKIGASTLTNNLSPNTTSNDWIQFFGTQGLDNIRHLKVNQNGIHITAETNASSFTTGLSFPTNYTAITPSFPTPNSSNKFGWYVNLCFDGYINYSTLLSNANFTGLSLGVTNHATYITSRIIHSTNSTLSEPAHPLTLSTSNWGGEQNEFGFQKIVFKSEVTITDSIFPVSQTVCKFATPEMLGSVAPSFPSDSLPSLYLENQVLNQYIGSSYFHYQWQISASPSGPWTNISGANLPSYLPSVTTFDKYYRRLTYIQNCGNNTLFSTSNVSAILVNNLTAQTVDAGGPYHSCPGVALNIGGAPTAIGGLAPYTYVWNQNIDSVANPLFSTSQNAILELTVIDANGCIKKDQAVFYVHQANAGPDRAICDGSPTSVGTPLQGLSGVSYNWTPSAGLSCTTCPSPTATPTTPTQYIFTQTLQLINGSSCTTTDTINLDIVAGPGPNFAGADTAMCYYGSINIGSPSLPGFVYEWSPIDGLTTTSNSMTAFYPTSLTSSGNLNPITYTLTAQNQNCFYTDEVTISYMQANAGPDVCDSGAIGTADNTPSLNETYSWSILSGPGDFTGPTNTATSSAYTYTGQSTILELEVTLDGVTCVDQVVISDCGGSASAGGVGSNSPVSCPSNILAGDTITLAATPIPNPNVVYNWSPQTGLSAYTGQQVELWTNQHTYYYVTSVDTVTNQVLAYDSVEVNNPQWTLPDVSLLDTLICPNTTVAILNNYNSNYTYYWSGLPFGAGANPYVTPYATSTYYVTALDPSNGCSASDTSTIIVDNKQIFSAAGQDKFTCSNDIIQIGKVEDTNFTYLWSPAIAPWQNGTDEYDADPYVSLSTTTQFFLTYTTKLAGCVYQDSVTITISDQPIAPVIPDESSCNGGYTSVNLGNQSGIEYAWSPASAVNCSTCSFNALSPAATTQYTVTLYYENSSVCPDSSSTSFTIFVSDPSFNLTDFTYCYDGSATSLLNSNPPVGFSQYSWTPSNLFTNPNTMAPDANLVNGNYQLNLTVTDSAGCTASDVVNITSSLPSPNAGYDKVVCLDDLPVSIGSPNNTGILSWSPAIGIADPSAAQTTFTTTTPGTYNLILTSTVGNCSQTDSVQVTVHGQPATPTLTDQMVCSNGCVDIGITAVPGMSYNWSPITGLTSTNSATTTACVSQTSQYDLEITDQNGCSTTGSVNIIVNNVPPPAISLPPLTVCDDVPTVNIAYQINPATGNYAYTWGPSSLFSNQTSSNQTLNTPALGNYNISLEVLDQSTGCIGSTNTNLQVIDCSLIDTCEADIDLNLSASALCSTDTLNFQISSDTMPINYNWTYTGYSSNSSGYTSSGNIIYTNTINQIDTVHFQISPYLSTCIITPIDSFFIVYPNVQPNLYADLLYCAGDSSLFYTDDIYTSYNWNGTINTDTSAYFTAQNNPILISLTDTNNCVYTEEFNIAEHNWQNYYDTTYICMNDSALIHGNYQSLAGTYSDTFSTALCDSISTVTLLVNSSVNLTNNFSSTTICQGDDIQLNLSGAVDYYYDGNPISATELISIDSTSTIIIYGEDVNGCSDTLQLQVTVNYTDSVTLFPPPISCDYFEGYLNMQSAVSLSDCQWTLSNGSTYNDCNPLVSVNSTGCYDVSFSATDPNGCLITANGTNFICIEEGPQAQFTMTPNEVSTINNQVTFISQATNATDITWLIHQDQFSTEQVYYNFPTENPDSYQVCLIATSSLGCIDTNCILLEVKEELILYVPNTFTPDGNSINNEFFAVSTTEVETFHLQIFNRWGEVIFESKDINEGWDGTYKGKLCQDGVYTWKIKYKEIDKPEPNYMQGHVTLVK
ncbi:gliding motility-associated C-terminal domain-containing protein [Lishizhenia tianjinensis]|uniref:Gliding motility-associated C-terminal domain-containing protein n=1 Tax=Lishizhenia tianjinensis TaxID=477690 RepID=A0A1I7ADG5_9FLAO|nr:gliding motility-associated C-terminal domain-containing protein [Lishizhenia tianjinensis]SFT72890.1 gliding motility-associated C-terminal domain-containing protein [Lishizhenia tianjinensis]